MPPADREEFSLAVMRRVEQLPEFKSAEILAVYWPLEDEVDMRAGVEAWSREKTVLLPVVVGDELVLRRFTSVEDMRPGAFGIMEPRGEEFTETGSIDMIIVPGVGFDCGCRRLGRGKGYYDRLLPKIHGFKAGVCFGFQVVECVPSEVHDVEMDVVVTPQALYRRRKDDKDTAK